MLQRLLLVLVIVAAAAPAGAAKGKAPKKPEKPSWVVLVHSEGDVPSSWAPKLRSAAEKAQPERGWVDPPAVTLDEAAAVVGCSAWGAPCAAQVAGMTGAQNALVIDLKRKGAQISLNVDAVDAGGGVVAGDPVDVDASDDGFKVAVAWVQGAVKGARPTIVIFTADVDPTDVVLDNAPLGKTPLTLVDIVTAGPHTVLFKREGKAPLTRSIDVKAGAVTRENGVLSSGGPLVKSTPVVGDPVLPPTTTTPAPAPASSIATIGWVLAGVGGAVGVIGLVGGVGWLGDAGNLSVLQVDKNGDPVLKDGEPQFQLPTNLCRSGSGDTLRQGDFRCAKDIANPDRPSVAQVSAEQQDLAVRAAAAFVVAAIGIVVAGTGTALALTSGEDQDAAVGAPVSQ